MSLGGCAGWSKDTEICHLDRAPAESPQFKIQDNKEANISVQ